MHAIENVEVKASSKSTNSDSDSGSNTEVSTPVNDVIISNVTVETYGVDYGIPETVEEFDMNSTHILLADSHMKAKDAQAMLDRIDKVDGVKTAIGIDSIVGPSDRKI